MDTPETIIDHPRVTWPEVKQLLRRSTFRSLVGTRVVGQMGDGMVQASLATFVLFSPESQATPIKIATAFAILLLPYSFFGPFIGVLIDRWPRQQILFWVSLIRSVSVIFIGFVVISGDEGAYLGTAVLISLGIGRFMQATLSASLPHVASGRELVTANAFAPTAGTMASAIGGLSGVAIQKFGGPVAGVVMALSVSALLQIGAAFTARTMARDLLGPDSVVLGLRDQVRAVAGQLQSGLEHLLAKRAALRALLIVVAHRSVFGLVTVQAIVLLRESLNVQSAAANALGEFTLVVGGAATGAFIGAVMTPVMVGKIGTRPWTAVALIVGGIGGAISMLLVIMQPKATWAMAALIVCALFLGWTGQSVKVCADSIVQHSIEDDHRGRVFALYDMAVNVGLVSGIITAAVWLAPTGRSYWAIGFIGIVLCLTPLLLRTPPRT
jgi:MFS family permease